MKQTSLSMRLLLIVITLAVLLYLGANLAGYLTDPFSTTLAYAYTCEHTAEVSGYVVRQETVLEGSSDYPYYVRSEGEKVGAGDVLMQLYQSESGEAAATERRELQERQEQLTAALSTVTSSRNGLRSEQELLEQVVQLRSHMAEGDLTAAIAAGGSLRTALLQYTYAFTGSETLTEEIAATEEALAALPQQDDAEVLTAPSSGLFSSMVDGYESVLTPESLTAMTAQDYRRLQPEKAEGLGKLVLGNRWYFVTLLYTESAAYLQQGDTVTLRFQNGRDVTMQVERIEEEASQGQHLVVLSSDCYLYQVTALRRQSAKLIFQSYTGIRVPRSAVRVVETEEGSDTAVYCLWGAEARQKPVEIIWQADNYLLVQSPEGTVASRQIRSGDTVIVAAEDLYDGKIIS